MLRHVCRSEYDHGYAAQNAIAFISFGTSQSFRPGSKRSRAITPGFRTLAAWTHSIPLAASDSQKAFLSQVEAERADVLIVVSYQYVPRIGPLSE
jgi:hypothetical protein